MATRDILETPQRVTLTSLPGELHNYIVAELDAIGLISLSQTSHYFRSLIKPNKREMGEWLLAIEDRREHEAHVQQYSEQRTRPRGSRVYKKRWELHKWACTGCLRMLSHIHFDNRSLHTASTTARWRRCGYIQTSWTPKRSGGERDSRLWELVCSPVWDRLCNECQYQAGILSPPSSAWDGQRPAPVQCSRTALFRSTLDRFYPCLERVLGGTQPVSPHAKDCSHCQERRFSPHRVYQWQLCMARCPGCERWQELREFREPPMLEMTLSPGALCNSCYNEEFGREALGEDLLPHLKGLIVEKMEALERHLTLYGRMLDFMWPLLRMREGLLWVIDGVIQLGRRGRLTREKIDRLTKFHEQYTHLRHEVVTHEVTGRQINSLISLEEVLGFEEWFLCFEEFKAEWLWLAACEEKIDREPGLLAEWALGRDGASLE
ncbi:unnamed protein product [Clonostachys rhizophaga]|uniref:F-box domain-containing protein n=1 Tax=Clonostachys rhizophaga TaxID=160324 RepID=A0A9N9VV93_9HYPO|nr:unnamed protein product [Clonostachys rhizophaga]